MPVVIVAVAVVAAAGGDVLILVGFLLLLLFLLVFAFVDCILFVTVIANTLDFFTPCMQQF